MVIHDYPGLSMAMRTETPALWHRQGSSVASAVTPNEILLIDTSVLHAWSGVCSMLILL